MAVELADPAERTYVRILREIVCVVGTAGDPQQEPIDPFRRACIDFVLGCTVAPTAVVDQCLIDHRLPTASVTAAESLRSTSILPSVTRHAGIEKGASHLVDSGRCIPLGVAVQGGWHGQA